MTDKALYTAGSEASIIIDSADYNRIVRHISKDPDTGLNVVAEDITDAFCLDFTSYTEGGVFSCFVNYGAANLCRYLDSLARSLLAVRERIIFEDLGGFGNNKRYFDIGEVCHRIIDKDVSFTDDPAYPDCRKSAEDLLQAVRVYRADLRKTGMYYWRDLEGMSVWFPEKPQYEDYREQYKKGRLAQSTMWDEFLDRFILGLSYREMVVEKRETVRRLKSDYMNRGNHSERVHEELEIIEDLSGEIRFLSEFLSITPEQGALHQEGRDRLLSI